MERVLSGRALFVCAMFFSMSTTTDLWGQDIALNAAGQARVAANGELVLTDGVDTGVQDIRIRLSTYLGTLFYDKTFGSLLPDWFYEDSTESSRAALCSELVMRTEEDPRVMPGSVSASILKWDDREIMVRVSWRFISEDSPMNLVLQADKSTRELVVKDASARDGTLDPVLEE